MHAVCQHRLGPLLGVSACRIGPGGLTATRGTIVALGASLALAALVIDTRLPSLRGRWTHQLEVELSGKVVGSRGRPLTRASDAAMAAERSRSGRRPVYANI